MSEWKRLTQIKADYANTVIQHLQEKNITYKKKEREDVNELIIEVTAGELDKAKSLLAELQGMHPDLFIGGSGQPRINHIAVPVDFSDYSRQIGSIAMHIGEQYQAKVWLVHSYSPPVVDTMAPEGYSTRIDVLMDDLNEAAKNNMNNLFETLERERENQGYQHVMLDYQIFSTTPEDLTRQAAEKIHPDFYIIGTRGGSEGNKTILGSVAENIISRAEVPVLAIPLSSNFKGMQFVESVVYATDFDESDFMAIKKLIDIIKPFEPTIHCLHIDEQEKISSWDQMRMYGLKTYFKEVYDYENVEVQIIQAKEVLNGLNEYIKKEQVGLVSLTTHKRNLITKLFNPSITREFLIHTHIPLLVFHG